jgi:MSHA biogenesis protein MshL
MTIAVNDADLRDILRAATADTDLNLIFEPGLDTRVQGLNLKGMRLEEILDDILPRLGMFCTRTGRNLYIQKSDANLRFYHVDLLAMSRGGSKTFQVNASGQTAQKAGNSGGNTSAYTSTVQVGLGNDPWAELENGLMLLIFGKTVDRPAGASGTSNLPVTRGYSADGKSLLIQPGSGVVMVQGDPATQKRVEAFLKETQERSQRQVQLEARIVEVTLNNDSQMGVNWNNLLSTTQTRSSFNAGATVNPNLPASAGLLTLVAQSGRVQAVLTALATDNRIKVLSAPRLSTLNNQKAILRVVTEQPYFTTSGQITPGGVGSTPIATQSVETTIVPSGIILDIQPQIGDDGYITLAVNPSVSTVVSTAQEPTLFNSNQPAGSAPVVNRRDLDAIVRVKSGETLVLAGIMQTTESNTNRGVPWLRNVPVIGSLFSKDEKSRSRSELAIFITPTLMEDALEIGTASRASEKRLTEAGAQVNPPPPPAKADPKLP